MFSESILASLFSHFLKSSNSQHRVYSLDICYAINRLDFFSLEFPHWLRGTVFCGGWSIILLPNQLIDLVGPVYPFVEKSIFFTFF